MESSALCLSFEYPNMIQYYRDNSFGASHVIFYKNYLEVCEAKNTSLHLPYTKSYS